MNHNGPFDIDSFIGKTFGKFKIVSFVKKEPYILIFQGIHEALDRPASIKLLLPPYETDGLQENFHSISALEHENLITLYNFGFEEQFKIPYVVEQWIDGDSLASMLENNRSFSLKESMTILKSIVEVIALGHENNIIHGGITPSCICIDHSGKSYLRGFGIRISHGDELDQTSCSYLAPEQYHTNILQKETDVYQIGAILFRLLYEKEYKTEHTAKTRRTYANPYSKGNKRTNSFRMAKQERKIEIPEQILNSPKKFPTSIVNFLSGMLAPEYQKRFMDASEVLKEMEQITLYASLLLCPQCGKNNIASQTFQCQKCRVENLCFEHFIPEKNCCIRCSNENSQYSDLYQPTIVDADWQRLINTLLNVAYTGRLGILEIGKKEKRLEIILSEAGVSLYSNYICTNRAEEINRIEETERAEAIFRMYLVDLLSIPICDFEFLDNRSQENIGNDFEQRAQIIKHPSVFLMNFANTLQILRIMISSGGISFQGKKEQIGLYFLKNKVLLFSINNQKQEITRLINNYKNALQLFSNISKPSYSFIQYRHWLSLPELDVQLPFEYESFLEIIFQMHDWSVWTKFLPDINSIVKIDSHTGKFLEGGNDPYKIVSFLGKQLMQSLSTPDLIQTTNWASLPCHFLIISIIREKILEIALYLQELATKNLKKWNSKNIETVLLTTHNLVPEDPQICKTVAIFYEQKQNYEVASQFYIKLGNIYQQMGQCGYTMVYFEKALELFDADLDISMQLIELYVQAQSYEKAKTLGLKFFQKILIHPKKNEQYIERICLLLLKLDRSLIECSKALVLIYEKRKDFKSAIKQCEESLKIYERMNDVQAKAEIMAHILYLDKNRTDILKQLNLLGYEKASDVINFKKRKKIFFRLLFTLILCITIFIYETSIGRLMYKYMNQTNKDNIKKIYKKMYHVAEGIHSPFLWNKVNQYFKQLKSKQIKFDQEQYELFEKIIWDAYIEEVKFLELQHNYPAAYKLSKEAKSVFQNLQYQETLTVHLQKYQQKINATEKKAKIIIQKIKQYTKLEQYEEAVDEAYKFAKNSMYKHTKGYSKLRIPLVIETKPSNETCSIGPKIIQKTPTVYYYSLQKQSLQNILQKIRIHSPEKKEFLLETIKTKNNNIWKVCIIVP
ncbi:MAG: protein kinase [Planctomycetes bacterium]|nr:protein kinase [Planctomycetota bacterium]